MNPATEIRLLTSRIKQIEAELRKVSDAATLEELWRLNITRSQLKFQIDTLKNKSNNVIQFRQVGGIG